MSATVIVDALWGDSGKGKIAAYLAQRYQAAYAVRAGTGTNAGHSIYFADGSSLKTHQLPCAVLDPQTQIRVGSGVCVDPERFFEELDTLEPRYGLRARTRVDFRCPVITPEHRQREADDPVLQGTVGTVASGTGACRADFVLRRAQQAAAHPALSPFCTDVAAELNQACAAGHDVIIEGSQGTHLSLALSRDYPYCTSDNCTTAALADDVGLNWQHIGQVVLVVKALPSRVGAGPLPLQLETEEEDRRGIAEYGVTSGRRRRKASGLSWPHLDEAVQLNGPTQFALTFCDHLDPAAPQARDRSQLPAAVRQLVTRLEERYNIPVTLCDCGKYFQNIIPM